MDLDKLAQALSKRTQEFPLDKQAAAQLMAAEQKERWINIVKKICEHENIKSHTKVINLLNAIQRLLNDQNNVLCTSEDLGNVVQVASNLPLLTADTENLLTRAVARQPIQVLAAFLAEASDQLPLLMERERYAAAGLQRLMTPPVIKYMCDYIAHQKINAQPAQAVIKKLQQDAESTKKTIDDAKTDFSASLSSNEKEWKAFLQTAEAEKNAALEMESLGAATRIWEQKKNEHGNTFRCGFVALIAAFIVIFLLVYSCVLPSALLQGVRRADGDIPYGVIIFLLIPVVAVGWLLRIGGKVVTQALTLKSDAEQRLALLETYIRMVADPKSGVDKTDRALVLNALFRPLPGQEVDDVQPPTFLELMKPGGRKE